MNRFHHLSLFAVVTGMLALVFSTAGAGCDDCPGCFDGGIVEPEPEGNAITAADIGTRCVYDPAVGTNPTNTCGKNGLTCLITTRDFAYAPYGSGDPRNFALSVWEDQFTVYNPDGTDEGYCTIVGDVGQIPICPAGTAPKALSPTMVACLGFCDDALDCGRPGYVCDSRFFGDFEGTFCSRACTADVPDCVRSGWQVRPPATVGAVHLASEDFTGSSVCNVNTGVCELATVAGTSDPGEPCIDTNDCVPGLTCFAGPVIDEELLTPGVCMLPCKPTSQPVNGCPSGYVCQAGFVYNFGNPLDENLEDLNGFLLFQLATGEFQEGGGYCMPECQTTGGDCSNHTNTACGQIRTALWGQPWNQIQQCLPASLREGGE